MTGVIWTEPEFMHFFESGVDPTTRRIDPKLMPWEEYRRSLTDDELRYLTEIDQERGVEQTARRAAPSVAGGGDGGVRRRRLRPHPPRHRAARIGLAPALARPRPAGSARESLPGLPPSSFCR